MRHDLWKDGGFMSRKMWYGVFSVGACAAGLWLVAHHPGLEVAYSSFVTSVVSLATIVVVGNVGTKYLATKAPDLVTKAPEGPARGKPPQE